jgi:hypothetical protein
MFDADPGALTVVTVECDPGDIAISGGFDLDLWDTVPDHSFRSDSGSGWETGIYSYERNIQTQYAYALCVDMTP